MPQKAFFIGPYESGLVSGVKPWLIADEAFSWLQNAYVWRGVVKKRVGSKLFSSTTVAADYLHLLSRLRIQVDTTVAGAAAGACPGVIVGVDCVGQMFSIGNEIFTVYQTTGIPAPMYTTGGATTCTHDSATRAYNFVGAAAAEPVYWYPAQPVMGIMNYEAVAINDEPCIAFDQQFAYQRAAGGWDRTAGVGIWTGSNSQFFWGTNYRGAANDDYYLFVVNNNRADRIQYYTGAAWTPITPQTRQNATLPVLAANYVLHSARLCMSFKDRLIMLNTLETVDDGVGNPVNVNFAQRARWSQNGSPIGTGAPACLEAWYDDVPGLGSWLEAPTKQAIITAKILKDRLIVYFERSTWELAHTGNHLTPFIWQNIDAELGAESTFSSVLFDKVVFGVGQTGIHACDGLRVIRIDEKIPDTVFSIHNGSEGVERIAGIRDYSTEMVYWTFPASEHNPVFPNKMLVYNYRNTSWAFNDDSITAFGYYQNTDDLTWGGASSTWEETYRMWVSGANQSEYKNVLAGNQEGFTFILDRDEARNAPGLQITDIDLGVLPFINLTVINHNLQQGDFILIEFVQGTTNLNNEIFEIIGADPAFPNTFTIEQKTGAIPVGAYIGGGVISRVNKIDIKTKQFNFYQDARRLGINKVDFDVDRTTNGQIVVTFLSSSSDQDMILNAIASGAILGTYNLDTSAYALYPFEATQNRVVHPVYIQAEGDCIQLHFYYNDEQMQNINNMKSRFTLNSMTFYVSPTATRL